MKRIVLVASASIWIIPATFCAAEAPLGWLEVIGRLTQERTQAETCVGMIKSSRNQGVIATAESDL